MHSNILILIATCWFLAARELLSFAFHAENNFQLMIASIYWFSSSNILIIGLIFELSVQYKQFLIMKVYLITLPEH